jgi:O-antigen ligase
MSTTAVTPSSASKRMRRVNWAAALTVTLLLCYWAQGENVSWLAFVIGGGSLSLLAMVRWPYGALFLLIASSAMPRFFVELFGWKVRPEHFVVAIVSSLVAVWLLWSNRKIRLHALDYWVLSFIAINYISSAFVSSSPSDTLRWALLNNLAVLPYFLIRLLVEDVESLRKTFHIFLLVCLLESVYGILCYLSNHALGTTIGMEVSAYFNSVSAPYGSMFEPNLFGAYTACTAVLFLALYLGQPQRRALYLVCFSVASVAALLSFSRATLFAVVAAIAFVFWKAHRFKTVRTNKGRRFILGFMVILLLAFAGTGGVLKERFASLFGNGLADETAITRFLMVEEAFQEFPNHPILGSGTASLQLSFDWSKYVPSWAGNNVWVGNVTARILHDTGLLGFTMLLGIITSLWLAIRRALLRQSSQTSMLLGLSAGALLYAISFQATDGTTLAFCWVHLGLLGSAALIVNNVAPAWNPVARRIVVATNMN